MIVEDVHWLGWSQVLLNMDNEQPNATLLKESLAACKVAGLDQVDDEELPRHMTPRPAVLLRVPLSTCEVA